MRLTDETKDALRDYYDGFVYMRNIRDFRRLPELDARYLPIIMRQLSINEPDKSRGKYTYFLDSFLPLLVGAAFGTKDVKKGRELFLRNVVATYKELYGV